MDPIGRRMERGAALLFARFLTGNVALAETAITPGDPTFGEPDAILTPRIGIEVTQVYYSDDDALIAADLMRDLDRGVRRTTEIRTVAGANETFLERAQILLDRKATRQYSVPTYLVLDGRVAAIHSADEGPSLVTGLCIPVVARFEGVFLLLNRNAAIGPGGVDFFEVRQRCAE
jgi:hypothetical protein